MRDTIDMAREAGKLKCDCCLPYYEETDIEGFEGFLKAFEALVRADQDEKYKWDIHSCGPTCKRYACVAMREAVEAEREACLNCIKPNATPMEIADAIRARSGDQTRRSKP
jgi:hypothetical protein